MLVMKKRKNWKRNFGEKWEKSIINIALEMSNTIGSPLPLQFIDQVWRILWLMIDKVFNFIIEFLQEFYPYYMNFLHFNIYDFFLTYCLRA